MKVKLLGIQKVEFTSEDTGERIIGCKLHVVDALPENSDIMQGQRVAAIFTRLPCHELKIGGNIDLGYEQSLGSNKSRLVSVSNC